MSKLAAVLAGIASALFALGVAEAVAGTSMRLRSPVIDVGDVVIDNVPAGVKEAAISLFGTADKIALLVGIGVILIAYAALVGRLAATLHRAWGIAGIALFGAAGAVAGAAGSAGPIGAVPSLAGASAGMMALVMLIDSPNTRERGSVAAPSRRQFIVHAGSFVASAGALGLIGRLLDQRFDVEIQVAASSLPGPDQALGPIPNSVSLDVDGISPFVTSNPEFYRIDTALTIPRLSRDTYRLRITGMVDRELELGWTDLVNRRLIESDITMTCVSNEVGGQLVGNARWLGIPLGEVLAEAGIQNGADQIVGRSADDYTCGFPVSALDGRDAMIAIGMNGQPLPLEHGFPARLIVPGLYGYVSATKWLTEIELTTFDRFDHYWVNRGWDAQAPIKTQSRIDTPAALARIPAGTTAIAGVAWAQTTGIERVDVRVDEGPWQSAELAAELNDTTWRQWKLPWDAAPGRHDLTVRATDKAGNVQTEDRARPMPNGASGWHSVVVLVDEA